MIRIARSLLPARFPAGAILLLSVFPSTVVVLAPVARADWFFDMQLTTSGNCTTSSRSVAAVSLLTIMTQGFSQS